MAKLLVSSVIALLLFFVSGCVTKDEVNISTDPNQKILTNQDDAKQYETGIESNNEEIQEYEAPSYNSEENSETDYDQEPAKPYETDKEESYGEDTEELDYETNQQEETQEEDYDYNKEIE